MPTPTAATNHPGPLAARVRALKPSSTLAVGQRAAELKAQGVDVLSFAAGEPDFDTPQAIKDAVTKAIEAGKTKYAPVPGDMDSRSAIAKKLASENGIPGVTPDHVVVSTGGKQSLFNLFMALLDPQGVGSTARRVVLPVPAWVSYAPQAQLAGGEVHEVVTTAATEFKMTPAQLDDALTPDARILVLNSPSNPCGTMYTPDEIRALGSIVAKVTTGDSPRCPHLVVITDEIYEKLIFSGQEHFSIGSIPEIAERVLTVNGLSKAYAMTGWRVGYFSGSGQFGLEVAKATAKLQSQSTTCIPSFILPTIRVALEECADFVEQLRSTFEKRAMLMYEGLSSIDGLNCPKPTGAMYAFPDITAHFGKTSPKGTPINSALSFSQALLDEHHVALVPGEDFGTGGEKCCRLTYACGNEQIEKGIDRIRAFVDSLR
ncbi:MAG: pyridoxal phosphate-dependent aminotransferase [Phycisphaerales bacterium JB050]